MPASASDCRRARGWRCCGQRAPTRCCSDASTPCPKTCRPCSPPSPRIASRLKPMPATARGWRRRSSTRCRWTEALRYAMKTWWRNLRRRAAGWVTPREPETLPVTLGRRRIYVLPTRFGLFFALLLLAMGLGALNYNNNPALLLMLLLAGAAHTSLLAAHLQLSGLGFNAIGAEPVSAGTPLMVRVHARAT